MKQEKMEMFHYWTITSYVIGWVPIKSVKISFYNRLLKYCREINNMEDSGWIIFWGDLYILFIIV
jgi:hypothetical protein